VFAPYPAGGHSKRDAQLAWSMSRGAGCRAHSARSLSGGWFATTEPRAVGLRSLVCSSRHPPLAPSLFAAWLVELPFPVVRHLPRRPGSRLAERVVLRRGERRAVSHLVRAVVVVPALAGFEARDDPMARLPGVSTRMLPRRGIATPDVAALGTAPQMKPPATAGKALDTAITARRGARVDQ
jgi:hypothetical protein